MTCLRTRSSSGQTTRPVSSTLTTGDSTFFEPNQALSYRMTAHWEDGRVFVASRTHPSVNGGLPTVSRQWVDDKDQLVVLQDWGAPEKFETRHARVRRSSLVSPPLT